MMYKKQGGEAVVMCDDCGLEEKTKNLPLQTFWEELRLEGWRGTRKTGRWENHCPVCKF